MYFIRLSRFHSHHHLHVLCPNKFCKNIKETESLLISFASSICLSHILMFLVALLLGHKQKHSIILVEKLGAQMVVPKVHSGIGQTLQHETAVNVKAVEFAATKGTPTANYSTVTNSISNTSPRARRPLSAIRQAPNAHKLFAQRRHIPPL